MIPQYLAILVSALPNDASALQDSITTLKSSISALESSLKTLDGSSGCWEKLAWFCGFAVGVGIIGELVVIVSEDRDDLHDWRRGANFWLWRVVLPPDRSPRWRFWLDIVVTVLVLAGVFGEAGASLELASINSQLRSRTSQLRADSDQLLALTTQEAGDAASSAGLAHKQLDAVKDEYTALSKKAGLINTELTFAQRMLGARHILNDASLENDLARDFKGKVVIFKSYVDDPEAFMVCQQLFTDANKPEAGVTAVNECADEPLPPHLQVSELRITAPTIEEAQRLSMIIGRAGGVISLGVTLGQTPDITVLVGKQTSQPLFWPNAARGSSKEKRYTRP